MKKRGKKQIILIGSLIFLIVILISFGAFSFNQGAKISTNKASIAGSAIQDVPAISNLARKYSNLSPSSRLILIAEWLAVLIMVLVVLVRGELILRKDMALATPGTKYQKPIPHTDLDILYMIIKEKKNLRIGTITKLFGVKKKVAMSWCNTLEKANLATLHYPTVGDPKIILNEPKKPNEKRKHWFFTKPAQKAQ